MFARISAFTQEVESIGVSLLYTEGGEDRDLTGVSTGRQPQADFEERAIGFY
jgi:hypothetical protein